MFYPTEYYGEEFIKKQKIKEEKRKIRKSANLLGVAFFIMTLFMVMWSFPLGILTGIGVIHPNTLSEFLNDSTLMQGIQIIISSVAFILSYTIYAKLEKERLSDISSFKKADRPDLMLPLIFLGLGVSGLSNFLTSMAGSIFQSMGIDYEVNTIDNPTNPIGIVLAFIATAITPALVEEFALRGAVMGTLRKYGDGFAIIVSSFIFGLMHGNFIQIPFAFIMGLVFAYVVIKTGTIWTAVIIHFINNFLSLLLDYLTTPLNTTEVGIVNLFYLILLFVCGFVGLYLLHRKNEMNFNFENEGLLTVPEKLKVFFSSPMIIVIMIVVIIEATFIYV